MFLTLLRTGLNACPALHVLVAVRPEFLGDFTATPHGVLFNHPYPIGSLEPRLLREVILRPAQAAGWSSRAGWWS